MRDLSMKDKIAYMFGYLKDKCQALENGEELLIGNKNIEEYHTAMNTSKLMFGFVSDMMGYSNMPQIVPDKEWESIEAPLYFHGFSEYDYGAEFLTNYNFHYGNGSLLLKGDVNGFYLTDKAARAMRFTSHNLDDDNVSFDKILPLKIKPDVKTCNITELYEDCMFFYTGIINQTSKDDNLKNLSNLYKTEFSQLWDAIENVRGVASDRDFSIFCESLLLNPTTVAMLFNIEFVKDVKHSSFLLPYDFISLNRSNVLVSESYAKKFFEKSVHYKSGCFDETAGGQENS